MKFRLFLFITTLATAIFASCSADGDSLPELVVSENSDVEISLGLTTDNMDSGSSMRSAVESDENLNFSLNENNGGLGIYCLSTSKLTAKASIPEIDWTVSANNVCMNNVYATAQPKNFGQGLVTQIQWDNHYYYPQGGWYKYRLYGYSPRVATPVITAGTITVDFELDGTQDVIWGRTSSADYCASYFTTHVGETPALGLQHCLACLKFRAIAGDNNGDITVESRGIRVTGISVMNVPVHQTLTIANRLNPEEEGMLVPKEGTANASVYLRDDISGSGSYLNGLYKIKTTHTDSNPLVIGDEMMLPPSSHYYIKVTMCDKLGNDCSPQGYFRIAPTGSSFEAGKIYWIQMRISAKPEDAPGGIEIIND